MSPAAVHNTEHHSDNAKEFCRAPSPNPVAAAIDRLPVELLIQIFVHCSRLASGSSLPQLVISEVCRFWREIVLNTPHAWQQISLDDRQRSIRASHTQAALWLDRSQSLPVDIHINLEDADNLLPLVSPLLTHVRRWGRLTLTGKLQEDIDFASFSQEGSVPILDTLSISVKGLDVPLMLNAPNLPQGTIQTASSMKIFRCSQPLDLGFSNTRFHKISLHADVFNVPLPTHMSAVHLHSLYIHENSVDVVPDPTRLINFLLCCPELRAFQYHALPYEPAPPSKRNTLPIVHLPRLHTLVLRSTCAVRAILSHIDAPGLRELYLEHTNMEFQLQHAGAFTEVEEGDSGDEAADFSQSPWSDHATGMGLRNLIQRSNPPLEVLEMDYADMRTKDFLWCFDRLNHLQEFRIVASDMSDKVISLLAPFRHGSRPSSISSMSDIEESEEAEASSLSPLHVRMPKLSALELCNCQRLTGDALVAALSARVQYTDNAADRNAYSKLSDVTIAHCADFMPRHAATLLTVLGTRLRVQV
ncbi:hypothetical protein BDW22DRAFT_1353574 [Trametopsis cervina]|nr:hypothetical protein BDW22DRAFT_1353574 [Trametopsis cervina]